jgi:hypothetical protein
MAKKCMKCGGAMKMAKGGSVSKPFAAGIPYATGAGATDGKNGMMKKGGAVKKAKLAALAAPKNKITRADVIVGAKRNAKKK